jgi:hypothetical protein
VGEDIRVGLKENKGLEVITEPSAVDDDVNGEAWSELLQRRGQAVLARGVGGSGKQALSGARGTAGALSPESPEGGARGTRDALHPT